MQQNTSNGSKKEPGHQVPYTREFTAGESGALLRSLMITAEQPRKCADRRIAPKFYVTQREPMIHSQHNNSSQNHDEGDGPGGRGSRPAPGSRAVGSTWRTLQISHRVLADPVKRDARDQKIACRTARVRWHELLETHSTSVQDDALHEAQLVRPMPAPAAHRQRSSCTWCGLSDVMWFSIHLL